MTLMDALKKWVGQWITYGSTNSDGAQVNRGSQDRPRNKMGAGIPLFARKEPPAPNIRGATCTSPLAYCAWMR